MCHMGKMHHMKITPRKSLGVRFIPACAGNSFAKGARQCWQPVHPRVCGEQTDLSDTEGHGTGSSPRVRGTDPGCARAGIRDRFIPACAGNSAALCRSLHLISVHPRVCGEQIGVQLNDVVVRGSSPRVRGTVLQNPVQILLRRFIPACAGNRPERWKWNSRRTVHPRVCGEQYLSPI